MNYLRSIINKFKIIDINVFIYKLPNINLLHFDKNMSRYSIKIKK